MTAAVHIDWAKAAVFLFFFFCKHLTLATAEKRQQCSQPVCKDAGMCAALSVLSTGASGLSSHARGKVTNGPTSHEAGAAL